MARRLSGIGAERATIRDVAARAGVSPSTPARVGAGSHEAFGARYDPDMVVPSSFTREAGARATKRLLASGREFTAVFAATDMVAAGVALHPEEPQYLMLGTHTVIRGSAGRAPGLSPVNTLDLRGPNGGRPAR